MDAEEDDQHTIIVPSHGLMMGSSASRFLFQTSGDIYLQDIWESQGAVFRIVTACVAWRMSVAFIEGAFAPQPGQPGDWAYTGFLNQRILVDDLGQQIASAPILVHGPALPGVPGPGAVAPLNAPNVPNAPLPLLFPPLGAVPPLPAHPQHGQNVPNPQNAHNPAIPIPNAGPPGLGQYELGNRIVVGHRLPWHHQLILRAQDGAGQRVQLHYHKHKRRKGHEEDSVPAIMPKGKKRHWVFDKLVFNTQIQNCRRAEQD